MAEEEGVVWICSIGEHAGMGKGTYEYDGSKEPQ